MKKKTIEKIPFLGLPKVKRNKSVEYVVVTAIKEVGREECLFLEAYRNRKDAKKIPAARIVIGGKDFGTYFPGVRRVEPWKNHMGCMERK